MAIGEVPLRSSSAMRVWLARVLSTPACAAAMPFPGTTMAWMSMRPLDGKAEKRAWATQVAEAITSWPLSRSSATTDHVDEAGTATRRVVKITSATAICLMSRASYTL